MRGSSEAQEPPTWLQCSPVATDKVSTAPLAAVAKGEVTDPTVRPELLSHRSDVLGFEGPL